VTFKIKNLIFRIIINLSLYLVNKFINESIKIEALIETMIEVKYQPLVCFLTLIFLILQNYKYILVIDLLYTKTSSLSLA